ncbi:MAG: hypothetical protein JKY09_04430, partial [Crocinitomicaceae bacterium]|nr:hypothetical protein [Crocinitomicaceae bacterium]
MRSFLAIIVVALTSLSWAAEVQWSTQLEGGGIINGAGFEVEDGDYNDLNSLSFTDAESFGYVRLGLNERINMAYDDAPNGLSISVRMTITPYNNMGQPGIPIPNIVLDMLYSTGSNVVLDASDYRMNGVHRFSVVIDEVLVNGSTPATDLKNYVYLEGGFFAERYYTMDVTTVPGIGAQMVHYDDFGVMDVNCGSSITTCENTDEIFLNWDYIDGSEYYDLEWTWVDNYSTNANTLLQPIAVDLTTYEFEHNCTRIRTTDQHYRIPNIFSQGYLIYRVRGVGRWQDDVQKDLYGQWSSGDGGEVKVSNWPGRITIVKGHQQAKNWQYQTTYAEDGKKKEVAQYFDGSLRGRQTVTRINSDNQSVVGETVYDNEGRGVIQILPVPQQNPAIKYYPNVNQNTDLVSVPYNHQNFDWEEIGAACTVTNAEPLSNTTGAAEYYSVSGFDPLTDQSWQQYVPESNGYAFTQVEYTPDNTGRIRNQSGVGADHKIGSGHETYYYYLQPSQEELNRLFGYKVGVKTRYKKNMVVDANGQVSVSYLDAQGRVVATAMAGTNNTAFESLSSELNGNHVSTYADLLNKQTQGAMNTPEDDNILYSTGNFGALEDGLKLESQIGVVENGTLYQFDYSVLPGVYHETCELGSSTTDGVYYPYVYELALSLRDDCGEEKFTQTSLEVGTENIGATINNMVQMISESPVLNQGSYTLYKSLTVNKGALANYKADYLSDGNTCLLNSSDFLPVLSSELCPESTSCKDCLDELGTFTEFKQQWVEDSLGADAGVLSLSGSDQYYLDIYQTLK